jgi:hypothetical protein
VVIKPGSIATAITQYTAVKGMKSARISPPPDDSSIPIR